MMTKPQREHLATRIGALLDEFDPQREHGDAVDAIFAALILHYGDYAALRIGQLCDTSLQRFK